MKENLNISLIQSDIIWQQPDENLKRYEEKIASLRGRTDLVILPEMFTTGFSMDAADLAERMNGKSVQWLQEQASKLNAATCASLIIEEAGRYFNRFVFAHPNGGLDTYDKRHLFAMAGEHEHYQAGKKRQVIDYQGWRILPQICYDLRFPVYSRNDLDYDLLVYVANWPDQRAYDWRTLLRARAIENQAYVAAVNRVGDDANGHHYQGNSCVIDPAWRHVLVEMSHTEGVCRQNISAEHLKKARQKLPFLKDRDSFDINE
ncbi:MAG: amidohydrolase [Bacteroidota bacterium]